MEVCVELLESAINAELGGASRIELCSSLVEGGLTPTPGLLRMVKSRVRIPVFAMLRPRPGWDFVYSADEVEMMKYDAGLLQQAGADGFVLGALTPEGLVDEAVCLQLKAAVAPSPLTFHRAFDLVPDRLQALETIVHLGFSRILTSGGESSAEEGADEIRDLVSRAGDRIVVMPGAGIREANVARIVERTGAREFHASARVPRKLPAHSGKLPGGVLEDTLQVTSVEVVAKMIAASTI